MGVALAQNKTRHRVVAQAGHFGAEVRFAAVSRRLLVPVPAWSAGGELSRARSGF
jgi:hypothetical protein